MQLRNRLSRILSRDFVFQNLNPVTVFVPIIKPDLIGQAIASKFYGHFGHPQNQSSYLSPFAAHIHHIHSPWSHRNEPMPDIATKNVLQLQLNIPL
jgi:hypothetical protein